MHLNHPLRPRRPGGVLVRSAGPALVLAALVACAPRRAPEPPRAAAAAPVNCRPEGEAAPLEAGRRRLCVIDAGSRNVKLVVSSIAGEDPRSLREDRVCRVRLQLGEKTFDQETRAARPLSPADREGLAQVVAGYVDQCQRDGGRMLGAVATEWARRATNPEEIRRAVEQAGVSLEILTREHEGRYGYLAAARGTPGKLVLDFGSRSVQISHWPQGAPAPETVSLPIGIDEAGDRFFGDRAHQEYGAARSAYLAAMREALGPALERMRAALRRGAISTELFCLAENGDVPLALEGKLWQDRRPVDEATYGRLLKERAPTPSEEHGLVTAVLRAGEVAALGRALEADRSLFEELRSDAVKRIYGYKMLVYPALVSLLAEELGLEKLVLVPQEMPAGVVFEKLRR